MEAPASYFIFSLPSRASKYPGLDPGPKYDTFSRVKLFIFKGQEVKIQKSPFLLIESCTIMEGLIYYVKGNIMEVVNFSLTSFHKKFDSKF